MKDCKKLTLDDVKKIATAAEAKALEQGWKVSIAICDGGGHGLWLQRMDGAPLTSATVAPEKARTSAMTGKPSKVMEDMINNGRYAALNMPVAGLEGGEPIIVNGDVVGAVGVSGVMASQDAEVAQAGIAALGITS